MRGFLGIVAGVIVVGLVMTLVSFIGGQLLPAATVNTSSVDAIKETYQGLGTETRLVIVASWFLGVLAGAAVAKKIVGRPWAAWTVAGLFELYLLASVLLLPMPGWMQVTALLAPLVAGFLANHLVRNRVETVTGDAAEVRDDAEI